LTSFNHKTPKELANFSPAVGFQPWARGEENRFNAESVGKPVGDVFANAFSVGKGWFCSFPGLEANRWAEISQRLRRLWVRRTPLVIVGYGERLRRLWVRRTPSVIVGTANAFGVCGSGERLR